MFLFKKVTKVVTLIGIFLIEYVGRNLTCNHSSYRNLLFALVDICRLSSWVELREMNPTDYTIYGMSRRVSLFLLLSKKIILQG